MCCLLLPCFGGREVICSVSGGLAPSTAPMRARLETLKRARDLLVLTRVGGKHTLSSNGSIFSGTQGYRPFWSGPKHSI